jgi:cytoskeletal protein CcmA (bactofilin family)
MVFGRKKPAVPADKIENVIGASASFNGHLTADGGIRIDGGFQGVVETAGNVIIGPEARVRADITARNVSVAGFVKGNIRASGRLEILSTGRVWGDISVASLLIDEGGIFRGESMMEAGDEPLLIEGPSTQTGEEKDEQVAEGDIVVEED